MDEDWGQSYFRKPPYVQLFVYTVPPFGISLSGWTKKIKKVTPLANTIDDLAAQMSCNSTFNKPKLIWSLVPPKNMRHPRSYIVLCCIYIYICIYIYLCTLYIYIYVHYIYIYVHYIYIYIMYIIYILYICRDIYIYIIHMYIYIYTCLPLYLHDIYTYVHPPLFTCNLQDPR